MAWNVKDHESNNKVSIWWTCARQLEHYDHARRALGRILSSIESRDRSEPLLALQSSLQSLAQQCKANSRLVAIMTLTKHVQSPPLSAQVPDTCRRLWRSSFLAVLDGSSSDNNCELPESWFPDGKCGLSL